MNLQFCAGMPKYLYPVPMTLLHILDLLSTFVFALVGARVAADKGLDYGGIAFIAGIASVSGGTLRNIFLGLRPIWIIDPWIITSIIAAVVITLVFRRVTHVGKTLLIMDTFGLAVATMSGTQLSFEMDVTWFAAILLGVITAVTGGLLRDVLCQLEGAVLILTRVVSIHFDLHLPKFSK